MALTTGAVLQLPRKMNPTTLKIPKRVLAGESHDALDKAANDPFGSVGVVRAGSFSTIAFITAKIKTSLSKLDSKDKDKDER